LAFHEGIALTLPFADESGKRNQFAQTFVKPVPVLYDAKDDVRISGLCPLAVGQWDDVVV